MLSLAGAVMAVYGAFGGGTVARGQCAPLWASGADATAPAGSQVPRMYSWTPPGAERPHVVMTGWFSDGSRLALWNPSDQSVAGLAPIHDDLPMVVNAVATTPDGALLVAGSVTLASGVTAGAVAAWDGVAWRSVGPRVGTTVTAVLVRGSGAIVISGNLVTPVEPELRNVAVLQNGTWQPLGWGLSSPALALAETPNLGLVAGGNFTSSQGTQLRQLARWTGSEWADVGGGTDRAVRALAVLTDGTLAVGGDFRQAGGQPVRGLARFDGVSWSAFGPDALEGTVNTLSITPDGELLAVGRLYGPGTDLIAAGIWNGTQWTQVTLPPYGSGVGGLSAMILDDGGVLFNPDRRPSGTGWVWRRFMTPTAPEVTTPQTRVVSCPGQPVVLEVAARGTPSPSYRWYKDGRMFASVALGSQSTLVLTDVTTSYSGTYTCEVSNACGSVISEPVTLYVGPCACSLADVAGGPFWDIVNPDGNVDGTDFVAFINAFAIGDAAVGPQADVAGGGEAGELPDGTVDGGDFVAFMNAFMEGC